MNRTVLFGIAGVLLVLGGLAAPIVLGVRQCHALRHFHVVRQGVLYRSAQLNEAGLRQVVRDLGVRTIVNLRDGLQTNDQREETFCRDNGVRFVRIKPLSWNGVQGHTPVEAGLRTFLRVMSDSANHPVLIHCYRGVHRTGGYVAVYRMEMEGWKKDEALAEMRNLGYVQLGEHADVAGFFESYRRTGRWALPRPAADFPLLARSTRP